MNTNANFLDEKFYCCKLSWFSSLVLPISRTDDWIDAIQIDWLQNVSPKTRNIQKSIELVWQQWLRSGYLRLLATDVRHSIESRVGGRCLCDNV